MWFYDIARRTASYATRIERARDIDHVYSNDSFMGTWTTPNKDFSSLFSFFFFATTSRKAHTFDSTLKRTPRFFFINLFGSCSVKLFFCASETFAYAKMIKSFTHKGDKITLRPRPLFGKRTRSKYIKDLANLSAETITTRERDAVKYLVNRNFIVGVVTSN